MKTYQLRCMAPDGATVREGEFPSVSAAWDRASDMGSRWFFYPVAIVTGESRSDLARIVDAPPELKDFIGLSVRRMARIFAANAQAVADWVNGDAPCNFPNL